jgi:hypothetical protein
MKILLLILLVFVSKSTAASPWPSTKCVNVIKFVELLVPTENRKASIDRLRIFLNNRLTENIITVTQYNARKTEILEAGKIISKLEAKGHKGEEVIALASLHCAV